MAKIEAEIGDVALAVVGFLRSLLEPIHQGEQEDRQNGIRDGGEEFAGPAPVQIQSDQLTGNGEVDHLVDDIKAGGDQQAGRNALDVELYAQRRRAISDDRFRNSVHAVGIRREAILKQADDRAGQQAGDLAAPRHCEKNHDQQRQIKNHEPGKPVRNKRLQGDCSKRNSNRNRSAEPVDLHLLAGSVGDGHLSGGLPV